MLATWVLSLPLRDVSIVDVAWGLGFVIAGWVAFATAGGDGPRPLLAAVLSLWGLRLAGHIALRSAPSGEDPRYAAWREKRPDRSGSTPRRRLALQGVLLWIVRCR